MDADNKWRYIRNVFKSQWHSWWIWGICLIWASFQIWTAWKPLPAFYQRSFHFFFVYVLVFSSFSIRGKEKNCIGWINVAAIISVLVCIVYATWNWEYKAFSRGMEVPLEEMILGGIFILLTMEVARRAVGWTIPIIVILLIIYARFGEYMPGALGHPNYNFERMITSFYISVQGIMGYLAHVSTTFIFIFVFFGSLLRVSGAGDFFIKLAYALLGQVRGGPGKIAVLASSLFAMLSGSAMANVAGTGQFTIPLMKKYGYEPHFAGGVEATASAGGQIMPPIMGGAAFIICEVLGLSYLYIMKSVLIIAVLYYVGIFITLDIESQKVGLMGIPKEDLPKLGETLKEGWFFLIPPIILLYCLAIVRYTPTFSGLYAGLSIIPLSYFSRKTRMGPRKIVEAMRDSCITFRPIGAILACAGLMVGLITTTGLGLALSNLLIALSHDMLPLLLFLAMISSIILGMGVPITASYVILSILVSPALIKMGVIPIAAHLFVFYFGIFSAITPPFAPDAFVAAGIAKAPVMKTAFSAFRVGLIGLILPYMMIYDKAFLMQGRPWDIIWVVLTSIIGIISFGSALSGYLFRPVNLFFRLILLASAIILIIPGLTSDLIGLAILCLVALRQRPTFYIDIPRKYFHIIRKDTISSVKVS